MVKDEDFNSVKKKVDNLADLLKNVKGSPVIQGYAGIRIDLNAQLNVVELNKRLLAIEARLTKLEGAV